MSVEAHTAVMRRHCWAGAQSKTEHPEEQGSHAWWVFAWHSRRLAPQVCWWQEYLSAKATRSSSIATTTNNTSVFPFQRGIDGNKGGHIAVILKDSFDFFFTIYLFIGPPQNAFMAAKQKFLSMYFISADVRELHAQHKTYYLSCRCTGGPWWREKGRRQKKCC